METGALVMTFCQVCILVMNSLPDLLLFGQDQFSLGELLAPTGSQVCCWLFRLAGELGAPEQEAFWGMPRTSPPGLMTANDSHRNQTFGGIYLASTHGICDTSFVGEFSALPSRPVWSMDRLESEVEHGLKQADSGRRFFEQQRSKYFETQVASLDALLLLIGCLDRRWGRNPHLQEGAVAEVLCCTHRRLHWLGGKSWRFLAGAAWGIELEND